MPGQGKVYGRCLLIPMYIGTDADFGKKTYTGIREDGTAWQKVVKWFGYKGFD
jgi:hypothetical protein